MRSAGLSPVGEETGSAAKLADFIVENHREKRPLLFPQAELARDAVSARLNRAGVSFDKIVTYKTKPHSGLTQALQEIRYARYQRV